MTVYCKLVAKDIDLGEYVTYVFEVLDKEIAKNSPYIMCTRYPNWNHRSIDISEEGFLTFTEIVAGKDTWFDGKILQPYRYNGVRFEKFIAKPNSKKLNNYIL